MKKLSQLLVALLLLLCLNSKAQTNVPNDTRIVPLLKQAAAGQPELVISGRDNASRYVNMAVLDKRRKMLTWFTCYGSAFDSARLTDVEYNYIASKAVTPFDFYKQFCLENIAYLEDAESHFREFGKDALKDTTHNRQVVYSTPSVKSAASTLQKVLAMENLLRRQCLQLALFESQSPSHARHNDTFLLRKSMAGKMVRKGDTTSYYNTYLLGAAAKITLCKSAPGKLFVYNRQEQVIDSVPLKPEKYAALLKEKEDVFLLYRGWLELQSQQVLDARRQVSGLLSVKDTSLFTQTKLQEDYQKTLWHSMLQLEEQQLAIEQKISSLVMPDQQTVKSMLQDAYPDAPSEVSYLEGLGFAYTTSYTRGQKVYELTDHRGNVMATVSDKKKGIDENQDGVIEYYNADVVNANDYYPFGMLEPGRSYSADGKYRYGYNGKENDNEVKGEGNQQDYGMRIYDPRVGRFLSVDPLAPQYPHYTPYSFAGNMPIWAIDLDGAEPNLRHKGNGIYGVGLFDQFELGSIRRHDASLRIGKAGKQFQLQWLLNNNGQMVGYLASRVIPEGEYKSLYGGKGEGLQEAFFIEPNKFGEFASNSDKYYGISQNAEMYDKLWGEIERDPIQSLFDPRYTLLGQVGGMTGRLSGQLMRTIPIISRIETQILSRALSIINSKEFQILRDAHTNGVVAEVKIGNTTVLYEPDFHYAEAMTLHQEGGFILGPKAFSGKGVEHTVLWEVTRLETQGTGSLGVNETRGNTNSAEATADKLLPLVKEKP